MTAPPQGPGVHPPFPAPPVEGRGRRIGFGLGIGGAVVLLVCGGGLAAAIGIGVTAQNSLNERISVAVDDYFGALENQRYDDAYAQLCPEARTRRTAAEFRDSIGRPLSSHRQAGKLDESSLDLDVPVEVIYTDGGSGTLQVELEQNASTGELQVCRVGE